MLTEKRKRETEQRLRQDDVRVTLASITGGTTQRQRYRGGENKQTRGKKTIYLIFL